MAANPSSQSTTAEQTAQGSFAERIRFDPIYAALEKRNIHLTEEEKKKFQEITLQELRANDGGLLGEGGSNLLYMLLAFIQNIVKNLTKNGANEIGNSLSTAGNNTLEQGSLNQLNAATARINFRMSQEGGNLARAAELATTQRIITGSERRPAIDMENSIFNQLVAGINLPPGTSTSLNQTGNVETPRTPARTAQDTASLTTGA